MTAPVVSARVTLFRHVARGTDALLSAVAFLILVFQAHLDLGTPSIFAMGLLISISAPVLLDFAGLYSSQRLRSIETIAERLVCVAVASGFTLSVLNWALGSPTPHGFAIRFAALQFLGIAGLHVGGLLSLRALRRRGRNYRRIIVVGTGPEAQRFLDRLDSHPEWGLRVLALADEYESPAEPRVYGHRVAKVIDLPELFRDHSVNEVIVAVPPNFPSLDSVMRCGAQAGVPVTLLADMFGDFMPPPRVTYFDHIPAFSFEPVHHNSTALMVKRLVDLAGSSLLLLLAAPVLAVAAGFIRATSSGPVLFRQTRCGLHGRRFEMYKLRTMYLDAEETKEELLHLNERNGPVFKIRHDPRVTPVGRVLRRWSIDELPQLWNVLRGEMSLVGPRPPVPSEVREYRLVDRRRLSMRPGLTCWWQVLGRSEIDWADQVRLDVQYIDSWSLASDLRILLRTVPAIVRGEGAS